MCSVCNNNQFPTISGLCTHLVIFHSYNIYSSFTCAQGNCNRQYGNVQAFKKHLRKKHSDFRPPVVRNNPNILDAPNYDDANHDDPVDINEDIINEDLNVGADNHVAPPVTVAQFKTSLYNSSLGLASKLYSSNSLNRAQIQDILDCVNEHSSNAHLHVLKAKVYSMLQDRERNHRDFNDLDEMFSALENMFMGLETETRRINALKAVSCYIPPIPYGIGEGNRVRRIQGQRVNIPVELHGQYFSMKELLKQIFQLPGVLKATLDNVNALKHSERFTNVVQSPLWRNLEANYFQGRVVLPLFVYYDDVEPDNQTGSHAGGNKLGAVYFEVPCMPQHLLSALENIFVCAVFLSDDRHRNNGRAFRKTLADLRELEQDGIFIRTEEEEHHIYFALCLLLGDNLGSHSIMGYVESFSANYYCRFCKQHKHAAQRQTRVDSDLLRNRLNYDADVRTNDVSVTGIKSQCIWNTLRTFHVTENLAVDIMHDFLEGICHYDLCAVLDQLITFDNFFTIDTLNERIEAFDYGPDIGNRLSTIKREHIQRDKLKMSASEMLFFVRHLGLIIGDLVPEGNDTWKLYITLSTILSILMDPVVHPNCKEYLATLIAEHHELYCIVSQDTLKPKHHFMVHYPDILLLIGPLTHVWSMRFEGKHRPVVKQVARQSGNRKNFPLTVATRYSLNISARFFSKRGFPRKFVTCAKEYHIVDCENYNNFQLILPQNHNDWNVVEKASISGTLYKRGMVLAHNFENDVPLFGVLKWIVMPNVDDSIHFILSGMNTIGFEEHLQCFNVRPSNEWFFVQDSELLTFYPGYPRTGADGNTYVAFRHRL